MMNFILSCCDCHSKNRDQKALGHEMHLSRIILFDLLCKGLLQKEDVHVYTRPQRQFLYSETFPHISTCIENVVNPDGTWKDNVCDLTYWAVANAQHPILNDTFGYNVHTSVYRTPLFLEHIQQFSLLSKDWSENNINHDFIVVHFRHVENVDRNDEQDLHKIMSFCQNSFPNMKVVLFWNTRASTVEFEKQYSNLSCIIQDLQLYATCLHHERCQLVLSEWSGGGQFAQYVTHAPIYYYMRTYRHASYGERSYHEMWRSSNSPDARIMTGDWDFKTPTGTNIYLLPTLDECLEEAAAIKRHSS